MAKLDADSPTQPRRSPDYPDTRPLAVGLVSSIAFIVAIGIGPDSGSAEFYASASQVIPLLLLVLAVEIGLFHLTPVPPEYRDSSLPRAIGHMFPKGGMYTGPAGPVYSTALWNRLGPVLVLAMLIAGELVALARLTGASEGKETAGVVYGAIAAGLTAIALVAVFGWPAQRPASERPPP